VVSDGLGAGIVATGDQVLAQFDDSGLDVRVDRSGVGKSEGVEIQALWPDNHLGGSARRAR
jgi:hypothetical protein